MGEVVKRGRPFKPAGRYHGRRLVIRLTQGEYDRLVELSRAAGLPMGDYLMIRGRVRKAPAKPKESQGKAQ